VLAGFDIVLGKILGNILERITVLRDLLAVAFEETPNVRLDVKT
jgi:hypothetical protein